MADDNFNIKIGRILAPNGTGKFVSFAGRVKRAANNSSRSNGRVKKSSAVAQQYFSRRVIVIVNLVRQGSGAAKGLHLHLNYVERDSAAREGEKGKLFGEDEAVIDKDKFHQNAKDDRHHFRVIVSPEDGKEIGDLKTFVRNMMMQMEHDLDTKLEWVAANHYDTANPHSHVVIRGVRDNGKDLVIPREYISHGMRDVAEHLATLELGPITEIDVAKKLALQVKQDRFTTLDRDLLYRADNQIVNLSKIPMDGSDWSQRLQKWRVKYLSTMGLAEKVGFGKWRLDNKFERTLRRMGERGDILKAYHRALTAAKLDRPIYQDPVYDPHDSLTKPITGRVVKSGILDDVNDRSYVVLDTMGGEAIFVETGRAANIADIDVGMIVKAGPQSFTPKQSDHTIAEIASRRGGTYSPSAHEMSDPSAREEYIKAHVRRLEAMRRKGHAERNQDGSWQIPKDYLRRASAYEKANGYGNPVKVDILSHIALEDLPQLIGKTWLDTELLSKATHTAHGFAEDVEAVKAQRRQFLMKEKLISKDGVVTEAVLKKLEKMDLDTLGKTLGSKLGKAYNPAPESGRLSGTYRQVIQRPSGKYAVVEKSKEFSLVPWRETMDRNLGKSISGVIKGQTISWTLTKARGHSIS